MTVTLSGMVSAESVVQPLKALAPIDSGAKPGSKVTAASLPHPLRRLSAMAVTPGWKAKPVSAPQLEKAPLPIVANWLSGSKVTVASLEQLWKA